MRTDLPGKDMNADLPCEICGKFPDQCTCKECPVCGQTGDPECYKIHGLTSNQQVQGPDTGANFNECLNKIIDSL